MSSRVAHGGIAGLSRYGQFKSRNSDVALRCFDVYSRDVEFNVYNRSYLRGEREVGVDVWRRLEGSK